MTPSERDMKIAEAVRDVIKRAYRANDSAIYAKGSGEFEAVRVALDWISDEIFASISAIPPEPVSVPEGWISAADMMALRRFVECCEDSDSGGHDVEKDTMKRLEKLGAVRSLGFGRHELTILGDALLAAAPQAEQPTQALTDADILRIFEREADEEAFGLGRAIEVYDDEAIRIGRAIVASAKGGA